MLTPVMLSTIGWFKHAQIVWVPKRRCRYYSNGTEMELKWTSKAHPEIENSNFSEPFP
jgi:hypothetical protein